MRGTAGTVRGLFVVLLLVLFVPAAHPLDVPEIRGYVNDYAGIITPEAKSRMEEKLRALEESDSTQIFVLTVPALEGETIEEFAIRVFDKWKAGQKGKDNGVILIVAQKERKVRIEVGRGLEGRLTDLLAGRIIDSVIKPKFKGGDFEGGFIAGVAALVDATKDEFREPLQPRRQGTVIPLRADRHCIFLIGAVGMIAVIASLSRQNRGRNFSNLSRKEKKISLDREWTSGWATVAGIGKVTFPVLALLTNPSGGRMSLLTIVILGLGAQQSAVARAA